MRTFTPVPPVPAEAATARRLGIAVAGAGRRGHQLAQMLRDSPRWDLAAVCDADPGRARRVASSTGCAAVFESIDELLDSVDVDAVAIATPTHGRYGAAMTALRAGKHVLVEEPMARSVADGLDMVAEAAAHGLVLMLNDSSCYSRAVLQMRDLARAGWLGEVLFVDSVRLQLEPEPPEADVFWTLAPHDLAVLDFVLPGGLDASEVSAVGADPLATGQDCDGHLSLRFPNDAVAHLHVNRASPAHSRRIVIGGSLRTVVWDAFHPGILTVHEPGTGKGRTARPATGTGSVPDELAECILKGREPRTGGLSGLRILSVLEAGRRSLIEAGQSTRPAGVTATPPGEAVGA